MIVGAGGVGSAIAASAAEAGAAQIALFDVNDAAAEALAGRLRRHHPALRVTTGSRDPGGFDIVVNATPLGMSADDPMPLDVARLAPSTFVADVVLERETTAVSRRGKSARLRHPGRARHAVRADPGLS